MDFDFSHLDTFNTIKAKKTTERFPCAQCAGTGEYRGRRTQQEKSHCFACKGKGYFTTAPRDRAQAQARRDQKKVDAALELGRAIAQFGIDNPEMFADLRNAQTNGCNSDFITSLADQLFRKGTLSTGQIAAWHRGNEKRKEAQAARVQPVADLSAIEDLFAEVMGRGYKRPSYRAEGFTITPAAATSSNAGALYLKTSTGGYLGKMVSGEIKLTYDAREMAGEIKTALSVIAADPKGAAVAYGKRTGVCCCCGRELTDPNSIDAGIGPICAEKWGF